jgi:tetratricopeptide (TPR) repeat protein
LKPKFNNLKKIYYAVGGADQSKDIYRNLAYKKLRSEYPNFFNNIHVFEATHSAQNAVPIVAMPSFLSDCFSAFQSRFNSLAKVDMNYKMVEKPSNPEDEIKKLLELSKLGNMNYPAEISDYNGIASRYSNSEYFEHALAVYLQAINDYPNYYEFYAFAGELSMQLKSNTAKYFIDKAIELLNTCEKDLPEKDEYIGQLNDLLKKE